MGTPKTLNQAITNAVTKLIQADINSPKLQAEEIQKHVRDFLAQKFGIAMLEDERGTDKLSYLWEAITNEEHLP